MPSPGNSPRNTLASEDALLGGPVEVANGHHPYHSIYHLLHTCIYVYTHMVILSVIICKIQYIYIYIYIHNDLPIIVHSIYIYIYISTSFTATVLIGSISPPLTKGPPFHLRAPRGSKQNNGQDFLH